MPCALARSARSKPWGPLPARDYIAKRQKFGARRVRAPNVWSAQGARSKSKSFLARKSNHFKAPSIWSAQSARARSLFFVCRQTKEIQCPSPTPDIWLSKPGKEQSHATFDR